MLPVGFTNTKPLAVMVFNSVLVNPNTPALFVAPKLTEEVSVKIATAAAEVVPFRVMLSVVMLTWYGELRLVDEFCVKESDEAVTNWILALVPEVVILPF